MRLQDHRSQQSSLSLCDQDSGIRQSREKIPHSDCLLQKTFNSEALAIIECVRIYLYTIVKIKRWQVMSANIRRSLWNTNLQTAVRKYIGVRPINICMYAYIRACMCIFMYA